MPKTELPPFLNLSTVWTTSTAFPHTSQLSVTCSDSNVVASKYEYSRNHLISEKYKTVQEFKLHFPKDISMCNCTLLPVTVTGWKHSWKPFCEGLFSSSVAFLTVSVTKQNRRLLNTDFSRRNRYYSAGVRSGEYGGCSSVVTSFFAKKSLTKTDRCAEALS